MLFPEIDRQIIIEDSGTHALKQLLNLVKIETNKN